jgi:hypothetical protein
MARNARSKYDWPDDQNLQALLDEHGTAETARQVGCPPSSLTRRIRKRGLRGPNQRRKPAANGNGTQEAAKSNGKPEAAESNGEPGAAGSNEEPQSRIWEMLGRRPNTEPAREPNPNKEPVREPKPSKEPDGFRNRTFGNDDSAFARLVSLPKDALALLRRLPPPIWRVVAVVGLAAVAGLAAFISASNDPKTFERESSFAVRPSSTVPPAAINDVLGTLAQPDSAITETIVNMFGSPRLRSFAARSAGVPASSVGGNGSEYGWSATRRTGSTIIDMRLTGPDDDNLRAMQTAAGPEAAHLVEQSYPPYRLETLSAPSPPVQVGPKTTRTVGLALLLGALLGITLVLAERRLRSTLAQRDGPSRAPAPRGESWER